MRRIGREQRADNRPRSPWTGLFSVLGYPNARRYYAAVFLSFTVQAIQLLTRGWLIQRDTGAPFLVALVPVMMMGPSLFLSLFGGVLADRVQRKRIMVVSEIANMACYAALALLFLAGELATWQILGITMINGVSTAFSMPARQAMVAGLVKRHEVPVAIGMQAVVFNFSQIIGPGLAGLMISTAGVGTALVLSTFLILPVLFLYARLQAGPGDVHARRAEPIIRNLVVGLRYVATDPTLRWLLALGSVVTLTMATWQALLPTIADEILHGGAGLLGTLGLAGGIGGLVGAFLIAGAGSRIPYVKLEVIAAFAWAAAISLFAISPIVAISITIAIAIGITRELFFATNFGAFQLSTTDEFRGRVMAVRGVMFGLQPVGALVLGALAELVGVRWALIGVAGAGVIAVIAVQFLAYSSRVATSGTSASQS